MIPSDVHTGFTCLSTSDGKNIRIAIQPHHLGRGVRLFDENCERAGATADVEHLLAWADSGLLDQLAFEGSLRAFPSVTAGHTGVSTDQSSVQGYTCRS